MMAPIDIADLVAQLQERREIIAGALYALQQGNSVLAQTILADGLAALPTSDQNEDQKDPVS